MDLLNESAKGVYVIAATPFTDNGGIDLASIDRAIDSYIACGIQGITILGMMGEAAKLSEDESRSVASRMLARAGNVPFGSDLFVERGGTQVLVKRQVVLTGDRINDAQPGFDGRTN